MLVIKKIILVLSCAILLISCMPLCADAVSYSAKGMVLINAQTCEILSSKNPHEKLPMASTTKMMTALLLAETDDLDKSVVVTNEMVAVEGSSMGLLAGDTVSYYALLVGMMLSSGNDAANVTAICLAGSVEKFADMMNERARKIGMVNSNFVTPSGLDAEEHYSTAYDMALLAAEVLKNQTLRNIVGSPKLTVSFGNPPYSRTLYNHNKLLSRYDNCIGIKTGYTKKSGRCLVSAATNGKCEVIAVTLNASDDWNVHESLLKQGLDMLSPTIVSPSLSEIKIPVVGSSESAISVKTDDFFVGCADGFPDITYKIYSSPFLYAPVNKGDVVGKVDYFYKDRIIGSSDLYSDTRADLYNINYTVKDMFLNNIISIIRKFT